MTAGPKKFYKEISVKDLPKLDEMIKSKPTMLLIYATWCYHCKMFKPLWEKFAGNIKANKEVQLLAIESEVLKALAKKDEKLYKYISMTAKSPDVYFPKLMVFKKTLTGKTAKSEYPPQKKSEAELTNYANNVLSKPIKTPPKKEAKAVKAIKAVKAVKAKADNKVVARKPLREARAYLNEQIHGVTRKPLPTLIDEMISKYLGL
jgi:thiol-disulfide isomerase/thioredoxin